jgi:hypothetical protein
MLLPEALPSPLEPVAADPVLRRAGVELRLKRDDLIHPRVSGNTPTGARAPGTHLTGREPSGVSGCDQRR